MSKLGDALRELDGSLNLREVNADKWIAANEICDRIVFALPALAALADEAEWMRDKLRKMYPGGIDYELRVAAVLAKLNPATAPEKGDRR